jgi:dipeptidyl aminopeptidase/acylaminoacyl peptidase
MIDRRAWIGGASAAAFLLGRSIARAEAPLAAASGGSPSIEDLVRRSALRGASISPDGKQLAVLGRQKSGDKTVSYLALSTLPISGPGRKVDLDDLDVTGIGWAKNDRLLVSLNIWKDARGNPSGIDFGSVFIPIPSRRVMAMDPFGRNVVGLFSDETKLLRGSFNAATVVDPLPDDPRRIMMQIWDRGRSVMELHHVDVYTGEASLLERGNSLTDAWITQKGVPILRQDSTVGGTSVSVFGRSPGETEWKLIRKSRRDAYKRLPDFDLVGATPQAGVVLLSARLDGDNTKCIREFDLRTLEFGKVVASHPKYDLEEALIGPDLQYQAATYYDDRLAYDCVDPQLARHLKGINTYFKNRCNVVVDEQSRDGSTLLLRVSGPTEPGSFHVYDLKSRQLDEVGATRPWLDPDKLALTEALSVKTRDGVELACYLTTPRQAPKTPLPMVVMPHGGPEVRDHLDFDPFAQALAAQGWLVLQPNFRGSGGYGRAFADQGRRHWGDRMQQERTPSPRWSHPGGQTPNGWRSWASVTAATRP